MRPSLSLSAQDEMDSTSAPNVSSRTVDPQPVTVSLPGVDKFSDASPSRSDSLPTAEVAEDYYTDIMDDEAQSEDRAGSSSFWPLKNNSPSTESSSWLSWPSSSRVHTVSPDPSLRLSLFGLGDSKAISNDEISASEVGAGLLNLGNTCFMNAILQCFTHTVPLVQGLRSCSHVTPCAGCADGFCVICALREHVECSLATSGGVLSPSRLVDNLNCFSSDFRRFQQEDAHEFMQCALDKLEQCFLELKKSIPGFQDDNLVKKVFGGCLISKLRCCSCGHFSNTGEPLIDLSLEIENADGLPSALASFTKIEKIDVMLECDNCKEKVYMEKQLMLDQAPSIAALHLKRFKTDGNYVEKIDRHVDFPLELDLEPFTISDQNNYVPLKYDLYAVVVHNGLSSNSGHYFCFVRSAPETWHRMDDSQVTKVSRETVMSEEAYILFYARQGTPWFSTIMESPKPCLDLSLRGTSPTSVLDVVDSGDKPDLISIVNNELSKASGSKDNKESDASGSKEYPEQQLNYSCQERQDHLKIDDISDSTHGCTQNPSGSSQGGVILNGSENIHGNHTLNGNAMVGKNSHVLKDDHYINLGCQEVIDFGESDGFHALTPPASPSSAPDKFCISRDHLKTANQGSCKRSSVNLKGDSERQAARKCLSKMHGSRRKALWGLVGLEDEVSPDKKRKNMESWQRKKGNPLSGHR